MSGLDDLFGEGEEREQRKRDKREERKVQALEDIAESLRRMISPNFSTWVAAAREALRSEKGEDQT